MLWLQIEFGQIHLIVPEKSGSEKDLIEKVTKKHVVCTKTEGVYVEVWNFLCEVTSWTLQIDTKRWPPETPPGGLGGYPLFQYCRVLYRSEIAISASGWTRILKLCLWLSYDDQSWPSYWGSPLTPQLGYIATPSAPAGAKSNFSSYLR